MAEHWFETVAEARRRARRRLPRSVYKALWAGAERGVTLQDNLTAFDEVGFVPHVAATTEQRSLGTTVLGMDVGLPVLISPTGVQAVHPDGEVAVARAAAARHTLMGLSSFASKPVEEVVAANPRTLFQVYWCGSREDISARLDRAKRAGCVGAILTLDWSFAHARDWGSPLIPQVLDVPTMVRLAPEVIARPRWALQWARAGGPPRLAVPNMAEPGGDAPTFFQAYGQWMGTVPPTWDDLAWLREQWEGPLVLKGVMHVDDARRAADTGFDAVSVSNHGGNNLDTTPASLRALPGIVDAVGERIEVLMDGGIRRGGDVVKALALGARAVLIGRAALWGLAAAGQAGVENVLDIMAAGIDSALRGLGRRDVRDLRRNDVLVPDRFTRGLDADGS